MLVKNQKVKINWNGSIKKYYVEKGYPYTKIGDEFEVKVEDLAPKSQKYVLVSCDYCGIPFMKKYSEYNIRKEKHGMDDKDCCEDCIAYKREETCFNKYGVKNYSQVPEIAEKISQSRTKEFEDLTGMTFNYFTVISYVGRKNKNNARYWLCECNCESKTRKEIMESHLVRGDIKSCGCLSSVITTKMNKERSFIHLYPHYKEIYCTYDSMKKRCYNEKHDNYKYYGARGIKICDEWLNDFMKFYNWAIENDYKEGLTIERIDYDGNYEPNNCKWATWEEQSYNKSNTLYIEVDNEIKTTKQWADETGIPQYIIYQRYKRHLRKNRKDLLTKEKFFKPVRQLKRKGDVV